MLGKTHLLGGAAAGAVIGSVLHVPLPMLSLSVIAGGIGGLFPDIDCHGSTIGKATGIVGGLMSKLFKHRGVLHTPVLYLLLYGLFSFSGWDQDYLVVMAAGFFGGALSHLFLDLLNPAGLMVLWPVSKKRFHLLRLSSSGSGNLFFQGAAFLIFVGAIGKYFF